ncbi:AAA family ATPase, partial [bacterium]|nr:AAA family ATPase [bacterium]
NRTLFAGLAISKNGELCREWMNQYPVIFLSFKGIEGQNFSHALEKFALLIRQLCSEYTYLFEDSKINEELKEDLLILKSSQATISRLENSLLTICKALANYWHKPAILLIDEYDVPVNCAQKNGYCREMLDFMRNVLGAVLKTNISLKFAILTGCLRIAKESIFTGLNNFMCYSVSDVEYCDKFGFTESEVDSLLEKSELTNKKEEIKEWYDGYRFGEGTEIYCPWDILVHITKLQKNPNALPQTYWNNTSENTIVRTLIDNFHDANSRRKIEDLISGKAIEEDVIEDLTYDEIFHSEKNIWNILYLTGYLTKAPEQPKSDRIALVIPNKEISKIFTNTVSQWFNESLKRQELTHLVESLWSGDVANIQNNLTRTLYNTISYYDNNESYYHGFMTGLLSGAGLPVSSNKEGGLGRPDIIIEDGYHRRALIIELKYAPKYTDLETKAEEGLKQIEEKNYVAGLQPQIKNVLGYAIAFWKKESLVRVVKINTQSEAKKNESFND